MRRIIFFMLIQVGHMKIIQTVELSKRKRVLARFKYYLNSIFKTVGLPIEVRRTANIYADMITLEQIVNLQNLVDQVIYFNVPGDFVECGSHKGKSAMQIQAMIIQRRSEKKLHIYDKFNKVYDTQSDIKNTLIENFTKADLPSPIIHEGFFNETIPSELPDTICFVHIDCGDGSNPLRHKEIILYCLEQIFPRLSKGGVCLMMDYHDEKQTIKGFNPNPGVKMACDEFFSGKEEKVEVLYGNDFSHGYFRKI